MQASSSSAESHGARVIHWPHLILLTTTPLLAIYGLFTTPIQLNTLMFTWVYYFFTGIGITAGYHRYWSHRAYKARLPLRLLMMLAGTGAVEGSIKWWCRGHRAHHRYTDTDKDPYSTQRGLFWAHLGWMFVVPPRGALGRVDMADLNADPIVRIQHRFYPLLAILMGFLLPFLVCSHFFADPRGGFFFACMLRLVSVHHATFCVNSLAHYLGEASYDDLHTPRDHLLTGLVTFGEGYHNFHHEFPSDYRNAVRWWQYDPTKWLIWLWAKFGLAYGLRRFPENEIKKGRVLMREKQVLEDKAGLDWGRSVEELARFTFAEFQRLCKEQGKLWTVIADVVYDFSGFVDDHPGGVTLIRSARGRDATKDFNGAVHMHRHAARNLLDTMRVGVIVDLKELAAAGA